MKRIISGIEVFEGRDDIDGLRPCRLRRFGQTVVLAGANGSGKTRLLAAISSSVEFAKVISLKTGSHKGNFGSFVENLKREVKGYDEALASSTDQVARDEAEAGIRRVKRLLARHLGIEFHEGVRPAEVTTINISPPQAFEFRDPDQLSQFEKDLLLEAQRDPFVRLKHPEDALLHIQSTIEEYLRLTSLGADCELGRSLPAIKASYIELSEQIMQFTGARLDTDRARFRATMDGQSLYNGSKRLSVGQRWLLALSASVISAAASDKKMLILLDEPELFLHPAALIKVLTTMQERWHSAQFIIATHSVPLIAYLGFENVFWMYEGRAEYGGRKTGVVLNGLLGGPNNVDQLQSLTLEPSRLATLTFAAECLHPPAVADPQKDDPQKEQLELMVRRLISDNDRGLRMLDWGAGRGRLLTCLDQDTTIDVQGRIYYVAIENNPANAQIARQAILQVYGESDDRCFSSMSEVRERFGGEFFDVVVLCNVLHEIHPSEWLQILSEIRDSLHKDGYLLIIEDTALPHGELAHYDGFMIADGVALQALFNLPAPPREIEPRAEYKGRLFAHVLQKDEMNMSDNSLAACLHYIQHRSAEEIRAVRRSAAHGASTYSDGARHALHMFQFVNSNFAANALVQSKNQV